LRAARRFRFWNWNFILFVDFSRNPKKLSISRGNVKILSSIKDKLDVLVDVERANNGENGAILGEIQSQLKSPIEEILAPAKHVGYRAQLRARTSPSPTAQRPFRLIRMIYGIQIGISNQSRWALRCGGSRNSRSELCAISHSKCSVSLHLISSLGNSAKFEEVDFWAAVSQSLNCLPIATDFIFWPWHLRPIGYFFTSLISFLYTF
jgi:hypothetical protein